MGDYNHQCYYGDADYFGYSVPKSEGGLGPEDAAYVMGMEFPYHFGITEVQARPGETYEEAAYRETRERHTFLTDDNHTYKVVAAEKPQYHSRVVVGKNENSSLFLLKPSWVDDGPGALWFSNEFRVVTVGMIAAEIACDLESERSYLARAGAERDTVRGRKQAKTYRSCAREAAWRARYAASRWTRFKTEEKAA